MKTLSTTAELKSYCDYAATFDYVTVDTEFLREKTYYSKLCLVRLAVPDFDNDDAAVLVDPLASDLDLEPLYDLFRDTNTVKVFHAARQDLEIFWQMGQVFPDPLFDTQVAAMVCGFGDQVGYETLVRKVAKENMDKSSRFTDWSRRPLTSAQMNYAIGDVTHLRVIYEFLAKELVKTKRDHWVAEELEILTDSATYDISPADAWKRVKVRSSSRRFLASVQALAEFRENHAQTRNVPRNRVFKDDALSEIASSNPQSMEDLSRMRLLLREARKGDIASGILAAVAKVRKADPETYPKPAKKREGPTVNPALADLLRVLLKAKCEEFKVAQKLIASAADLDHLASGERDLAFLKGWRADVFGKDAIKLCEGQAALTLTGRHIKMIAV